LLEKPSPPRMIRLVQVKLEKVTNKDKGTGMMAPRLPPGYLGADLNRIKSRKDKEIRGITESRLRHELEKKGLSRDEIDAVIRALA